MNREEERAPGHTQQWPRALPLYSACNTLLVDREEKSPARGIFLYPMPHRTVECKQDLRDTPRGYIMRRMEHRHSAGLKRPKGARPNAFKKSVLGKKKLIRRLKIIEGQMRGLQEMVEKDTYCIDVITQTSAVKQGLSQVEDLLLENHLNSCVLVQMKSGQTKKAVHEVLKVYKLKRK